MALMLVWAENTSADHVLNRAEHFSDIMRVIRPAILFIVLLHWRPAADWLHSRSLLTERTHERALLIWPRLSVWTLLIEVTLGQGYLLMGLAATAVYWALWRLR
ncbi:MAG: hypothetical protein AAGA73_17735 [Pseudomonadota bacterium]